MDRETVEKLLTSEVAEDRRIGEEYCKKFFPFLWALVAGVKQASTGMSEPEIHKIILQNAEKNGIGLGTTVRYIGMDNCPIMTVTDITVSKLAYSKFYVLMVTAKWYNKSAQMFSQISERIESLEIIKPLEVCEKK